MTPRENLNRSKEVLGGYLRHGAHEMGAALFGHGTIAQHPEYGMAFTRPPGLVTDGLRGELDPDHSKSDVAAPTPHAEPEKAMEGRSPEITPPEPDLERD